ncbi:MAG: hypothetical protein KKA79_02135 [Nanoarchaeota archaeon]|nr:hypothetical protein [Nanoarchaeota archaeon]
MSWFDHKLELYDRLDTINSKSLAKTVNTILGEVDHEFWKDHCSNRANHPPEDEGEGGLIRHVIKCTYIFEQEARRQRFESFEFDAGMAAIILHDIKKNGEEWGKSTEYTHGIIGYNFIKKFYFADRTIKKLVMNGVRYHMAPWNTTILKMKLELVKNNPDMPLFTYKEFMGELEERTRGMMPNRIEKAVQDADFWGSRKDISFYPGVSIMPDTERNKEYRKHDTPEEWLKEILGFNEKMYLYPIR